MQNSQRAASSPRRGEKKDITKLAGITNHLIYTGTPCRTTTPCSNPLEVQKRSKNTFAPVAGLSNRRIVAILILLESMKIAVQTFRAEAGNGSERKGVSQNRISSKFVIVATSLRASFRGSRSSGGGGQEVVTINATAFQPWIAVGVGVSERYPSRWLWYGYPKLIGEAERAPSP